MLRRVIALAMGASIIAAATGFSSIAAQAAALPSVITGPPSGVGVTVATLSGDVDANGATTTYDFEYGTTLNYGLDTTVADAGAGSHEAGVSAQLDGLTPGTTYHYRLVARNSIGTAYGSDSTFKTPAYAPTIIKNSVKSAGDTAANVVAEINPNGLASTWSVRYGTSTALGLVSDTHAIGSAISSVTAHLTLKGLTAHTTYFFEVVTTNAAGTSLGTQTSLLTTGSPIIVAESTHDLATTSVTLEGAIDPDGHETSWIFQYGSTLAYGTSTTVRSSGSGTKDVSVARSVDGLTPNTDYHFRLVASSLDGTVLGADATFETPGPSLASSSDAIKFGAVVTLSGNVPTGTANEVVVIYSQLATAPSFVELATVLTGTGGNWAYAVQPGIGTSYKAIWHSEISPTVAVGVSPAITLREPSHGRFVTHVSGAARFNGRLVRLQRFEHGTWRTIAARALNGHSSTTFRPSLPAGRSRLRIYLTAYQAGPGYLAGVSGVRSYKL